MLCRSRSWVAEEGEVFRKGNLLLGPNEMEGEYAGEDLRIEVCVRFEISDFYTKSYSAPRGHGRAPTAATLH